MKKLIPGLGIALLLLSTELPAQIIFQNYFQWVTPGNPQAVDHGPFRKVKTWKNNGTPYYFAVGSATNPLGTTRTGIITSTNGTTGTTLFSKTIASPFSPTAKFESVSVAVTNATPLGTVAVLCNHDNGAGLKQFLLYEFDTNGNFLGSTNLGPGIGIDVAFNGSTFDVLSEVNGTNGTDFELTSVDVLSFLVNWSKTYSWGTQDKPTAMTIDNGDIIAAGYTEVGNDRQILMVRVDNQGSLVWGQAFGLPNRRETVSDVVFYFNLNNQFRYGFCGWDEITDQAFVGDVAISGPQGDYTERYITDVNGEQKKMRATAIARSDNNVFISGSWDNKAPFIATFSKDANLTPLNFDFFDDNENVREDLLDISCELGSTSRVVSVGSQQRNIAWGTSPANQDYAWIMTMSTLGTANCKRSASANTTFFNSTQPVAFVSIGTGSAGMSFVAGSASQTFFNSLDNCVNPSRIASATTKASEPFSSLYPNPGNGTFYLDGTIAETDKAELRVMDMSGRLVAQQELLAGSTKHTIDLNTLSNGIYCWSLLVNGEAVKNEKLIIAR